MQIKPLRMLNIRNVKDGRGFGLVDAVLSMSLLAGVITYGIYFSSIRLGTVYDSNLTRSINKEIQRDIEKLKSGFWRMYFEPTEGEKGEYSNDSNDPLSRAECEDFTSKIASEFQLEDVNPMIQSWRPDGKRSKVFQGQPVLISRELTVRAPLEDDLLDLSVANIEYRVQWGENNIHWLSIALVPEAQSWCDEKEI